MRSARGAVLSCGRPEKQNCPHISPTRGLCKGQDLGSGAATLDRIPRSGKSPHEATPARRRFSTAASLLTNPLGQGPIALAGDRELGGFKKWANLPSEVRGGSQRRTRSLDRRRRVPSVVLVDLVVVE